MKAFYIFTATLESVHGVYKDIILSIFIKNQLKSLYFHVSEKMYENIAILLVF